jgi:two-component system sensor histidine kinase RegB
MTSERRTAQPWYLAATSGATRPWLIRLRWVTAAVETAVVVVILLLPRLDLSLDHVTWLIAAAAIANAVVARLLSTRPAVPPPAAAAAMAIDIALVTGLLELTGGPLNPFIVIYVVQVALASLTLGALWTWLLGGLAAASFGLLVYWHTMEAVPGHHRLNDFPTHIFTMWIAVVVTAELAAYFIAQASNALARRERELDDMRARAAKSERLVSLTTLAAGAAHELSSPLATIAVAARELERSAVAIPLADDARLIRLEVDRCQAILDQMSGRAGGTAPDHVEPVDVAALLSEIRERLSAEQTARLRIRVDGTSPIVEVPRAGLGQVVASLVKNAFDASVNGEPVAIELTRRDGAVRVVVRDEGAGMSADVLSRAGEPFYTTKEPGHGLGLGLFLAHVFAERFGGTLTLQSDRGTTAVLELPAAMERNA